MNTRPIFAFFVAAVALAMLASCVEPPPGSESQIWQRPPRYGHGGTDSPRPDPGKPKPSNTSPSNQGGGGRFGYSGDSDAGPVENTPTPPPTERGRDTAGADKPAADPPKETTKPSGPPSVSEMPFAKGVPGKPLSVTLPAPHGSLGEISIEQYEGGKPSGKPLPPGTPVEIPDPNNPGKKIYFRVP